MQASFLLSPSLIISPFLPSPYLLSSPYLFCLLSPPPIICQPTPIPPYFPLSIDHILVFLPTYLPPLAYHSLLTINALLSHISQNWHFPYPNLLLLSPPFSVYSPHLCCSPCLYLAFCSCPLAIFPHTQPLALHSTLTFAGLLISLSAGKWLGFLAQ